MAKVCRESLAVVDSHRGLNNLSITSNAKITADPKMSMRRLTSGVKLTTETVGRAIKAVIYAEILCQHNNVPFDQRHENHKTAEMQ